MGTLSKTVQPHMESVQQKPMRHDEFTQRGWQDTADFISDRNMWYVTAELMVPVVVEPQTHTTAATPSRTSFRELLQTLDIVPRQSRSPNGSSRPGRSQIRMGSERPLSYQQIASNRPDVAPNTLPDMKSTPVERVCS